MSTNHRHRDIAHFDHWSQTYEDSWLQKVLFDRVQQATLDTVAKLTHPGVLLDVGCGTGRLLRTAQARWPHTQLIGVDPANGMIEVARRLTPAATFYRGQAEALPLPAASVDVALSTMSFHHWADHAAGIREIARVLRPTGYFFLTDVSAPPWLAKVNRHARFLSRHERLTLFEDAGLNIIAQQSIAAHFIVVTIGLRPAKVNQKND